MAIGVTRWYDGGGPRVGERRVGQGAENVKMRNPTREQQDVDFDWQLPVFGGKRILLQAGAWGWRDVSSERGRLIHGGRHISAVYVNRRYAVVSVVCHAAWVKGRRQSPGYVRHAVLVGQPAISAAFPEAGSRSAGRQSIPGLFVA